MQLSWLNISLILQVSLLFNVAQYAEAQGSLNGGNPMIRQANTTQGSNAVSPPSAIQNAIGNTNSVGQSQQNLTNAATEIPQILIDANNTTNSTAAISPDLTPPIEGGQLGPQPQDNSINGLYARGAFPFDGPGIAMWCSIGVILLLVVAFTCQKCVKWKTEKHSMGYSKGYDARAFGGGNYQIERFAPAKSLYQVPATRAAVESLYDAPLPTPPPVFLPNNASLSRPPSSNFGITPIASPATPVGPYPDRLSNIIARPEQSKRNDSLWQGKNDYSYGDTLRTIDIAPERALRKGNYSFYSNIDSIVEQPSQDGSEWSSHYE